MSIKMVLSSHYRFMPLSKPTTAFVCDFPIYIPMIRMTLKFLLVYTDGRQPEETSPNKVIPADEAFRTGSTGHEPSIPYYQKASQVKYH